MYEIIEKKKHGIELSKEEIYEFVEGYTKGIIPDYQASALLMAIYFKGLSLDETYYLTEAMLYSGETIELSGIKGVIVDKHSTGGVGDTTTLILGPLVASCCGNFAKMSGRGLGHTGGTLDKLESIPGFNINLSIDEFIQYTNNIRIAISGQTEEVTPADKLLYALRDATATVDNVSLICASIMSKKIAVGSDALILDVKVGSGAFMKDLESATELSELMVNLGHKFNRPTKAVITNMEQPLGNAIGNSLEVIEAIETLKGNGPKDLEELCLNLGAKLLVLAKVAKTEEDGRKRLVESIENGRGIAKFKELVENQGGDSSYIDDTSKFKLSDHVVEVRAKKTGYITKLDALSFGEAARDLGAGRETKESSIDLGAGILLNKKLSHSVSEGEVLYTIYTNREEAISKVVENLESVIEISDKNIEEPELIFKEIE